MSNDLAITGIKDIDEITEPVRIIRLDVERKEIKLREDIDGFLDILENPEVDKDGVPYALWKENRSQYKEPLSTIKKSMTFAISAAKNMRQELYQGNVGEEVQYDVPTDLKNLPSPDNKTKEGPMQQLKQTLGMKKTTSFDPNSPMAKMDLLISGLTEILEIFKRWLIWYEGLILEQLRFNTPQSLKSELDQLIEIFGHTIETNIWISFQYYRDMRESVAEGHSITAITSLQKQQDKEATRPQMFDPNQH
jgi:hypothetical protein